MRFAFAALVLLPVAAAAQSESKSNPPAPIREPGPPRTVAPNTPPGSTVVVDGTRENAGPGASATVARSGTGADTVMTDSAVGGNAEQPSRAVPQEGGNGGGSGGGGS